MVRRPIVVLLPVLAGVGMVTLGPLRDRLAGPPEEPLRLATTERVEGAPPCPWRDPATTAATLFPDAGPALRLGMEVRILSSLRPELARRLGRLPTAEENALQVHHVHAANRHLGDVLVRRVKGAHGAIELVLAVTPDHRVQGLLLQRQREPAEIAVTLTDPAWLNGFRGRNAAELGTAALGPDFPAAARASANAVRDGVAALLILHELAPQGRRAPDPAESAPRVPSADSHPH